MKKLISIFLVLVMIVSSLICILNVSAQDLKTYTVDFEDGEKASDYLSASSYNKCNAELVTDEGNNYLKLGNYVSGNNTALRATFALPDTTRDPYVALHANNNGDGKIKVSFEYKVESAVKDGTFYICRVNDDNTAGYTQANSLDPATLTNSVEAAHITKSTTTDWVKVENVIITTNKNKHIYLVLEGIRAGGVNSTVYVDNIVIEETNESNYTVNVGGTDKTITGVAGNTIDLSKIPASGSKVVTGIVDAQGNPVTSFPEDATTLLYAKTKIVNDFADESKTTALLGQGFNDNSISSVYSENAVKMAFTNSGGNYNKYIFAFAVGDYLDEPVTYLPNSGNAGKIKVSFKYKPVNVSYGINIYLFRNTEGTLSKTEHWEPTKGYFNSQNNLENNGLIAKKVATVAANSASDGWIEVNDVYFTSGVSTPIYIGVQTSSVIGTKIGGVEILVDDIILEETDEEEFVIDVNGIQNTIIASANSRINAGDFSVPFGKRISGFTVDGNPVTKYSEAGDSVIVAELVDDDSIDINMDKIVTNADGSPLIFDNAEYLLSYDVANSLATQTEVTTTVSAINADDSTILLNEELNLEASGVKNIDAVIKPNGGNFIKLTNSLETCEVKNIKVSTFADGDITKTQTDNNFDDVQNIFGFGNIELSNGEVVFKNTVRSTAIKESPQILITDGSNTTRFLKLVEGKPYRFSVDLYSEQDINNLYARIGSVSDIANNKLVSESVSEKVYNIATLLGTAFKLNAGVSKTVEFDFTASASGYLTLALLNADTDFEILVDNISIKELNTQTAPEETVEVIDQTATSITLKAYEGYAYFYKTADSSSFRRSTSNIISALTVGGAYKFAYYKAATNDAFNSTEGPILEYIMKQVGDVNRDGSLDDIDCNALRTQILQGITTETKFTGLMDIHCDETINICDLVALKKAIPAK